ncbi:MAG: AMP-binding protein [Clostridiales Family XIII bacterium]|jgi:long-subunit acyl-CoA synthetase (AMP-forming)|nr:AMP-binding protein [Clostridiales Family XIII bacterium]
MVLETKLSAEEYEKIKIEDHNKANELYKFIQNSKDPYIVDRDQRAIADLKHMFETSVELYADRPAFYEKKTHKDPYEAITYREAKADVDALGTALHAHGLRGKRIGIIGENSYAWATAYLATVCGAGIVVPLDKELQDEEIEYLVHTADIHCIFYSKKFAQLFQNLHDSGSTNIKLFVNQESTELQPHEMSRKDLLAEGRTLLDAGNREFLDAQVLRTGMGILLFTSGTTGLAKGVMLSHENLCTDLMIAPTVFDVVKEDIFFSVLPLHHTYECTCDFLIPLYKGSAIAYCEGLRHITENLAEIKPTMFLGVPLLFENMYRKIWQNVRKQGKEKLLKRVIKLNRKTKKIGIDLGNIFFKQIRSVFGGRMRKVICGGAAIDPAILDGIRDFGIQSLQGYGLTECAPICALNPITDPRSASAGYILPGFDGYIDDPDPETGIGEICVKGDNVMLGYYENPEATAEVLKDGWYHTGDYGYIDKDRFVYITGRKKNVIITKTGKNVFPEELEYYINQAELIEESMAWEDVAEMQGDTLIAITVRINKESAQEQLGNDYDLEALEKLVWTEIDRVNKELPYYKKIKKLYMRDDEFIKTTKKSIKRFVNENRTGVEA